MPETTNCFETHNIDLATYLRVVKNVESTGHYFKGTQLNIRFALSPEEGQQYLEDYLNSIFPVFAATRHNWLQLLKR
jgi:hypothetical protein